MFDPVEFFNLARNLYKDALPLDSALARTCINRAYYAAFLVARDASKNKSESSMIHTQIIDHYKKKNRQIGNKLSDLFIRRKKADYSLGDTITNRDSGIALNQAKEILEALGKKIDK